MIENKTIFITGGAGFIGSNLIGRLIQNNKIVVLDNLERNSLKNNGVAGHPNLKLIVGSILDVDKLKTVLPESTDFLIHCAAIAGIDPVRNNPIKTMQINMVGSANILEAASKLSNCTRVVCFSTSEVFGQHALNVDENENSVIGKVGDARWAYAVSKLAEEHLAAAYYQERKLPITILRPFNIYGPGQVGGSAMRNFIIRALKNEPLEIHGDGTQIRAWCYIDDMVDATIGAMSSAIAAGELFNIGNQRATTTISGLAHTVIRVLNSKSSVVFIQKNYTDVILRIPAVGKASQLLGFEAKVGLEEGIRRTAKFYETCLN